MLLEVNLQYLRQQIGDVLRAKLIGSRRSKMDRQADQRQQQDGETTEEWVRVRRIHVDVLSI
jgi:hypothetical protein